MSRFHPGFAGGPDALTRVATGRETSIFAEDLQRSEDRLREAISGKRLLVIGGAGTIGSETIHVIVDYAPACLHVVDVSENTLVELTRHLRSRTPRMEVEDFRTFPVDYGSPYAAAILDENPPYDAVLNFSALKHVRSEGSSASLLQMLDTNLLKNAAFMRQLARRGFGGRYFCVSTDKAANPVSLMGASKRAMEHLIFSDAVVPEFEGMVTSARFANVAFSNGSLLEGFFNRVAKDQPLACPREVQRYFVSPRESGEICAIAAFCAPENAIVIPDFRDAVHLVRLEDVSREFLRAIGYEPQIYEDEEAARNAVAGDRAAGRYPLLLTPLDTSGEKPYEEFVGEGEREAPFGLSALSSVSYVGTDPAALRALIDGIHAAVSGVRTLSRGEVVALIKGVVPQLAHVETGRHLDQRM